MGHLGTAVFSWLTSRALNWANEGVKVMKKKATRLSISCLGYGVLSVIAVLLEGTTSSGA